jgi:hypothetical protein
MSSEDLIARLGEKRLCGDLAASPVQVGIMRGWWEVDRLDYPILDARIATSRRTYAHGWIGLRFETTGYPDQPVTACPWDFERDTVLAFDDRPVGGRAQVTFRADWENGRALYLPCDRVAITGHTNWPAEHPHDLWEPAVGIAKYLRLVHTILNEVDHEMALGAA